MSIGANQITASCVHGVAASALFMAAICAVLWPISPVVNILLGGLIAVILAFGLMSHIGSRKLYGRHGMLWLPATLFFFAGSFWGLWRFAFSSMSACMDTLLIASYVDVFLFALVAILALAITSCATGIVVHITAIRRLGHVWSHSREKRLAIVVSMCSVVVLLFTMAILTATLAMQAWRWASRVWPSMMSWISDDAYVAWSLVARYGLLVSFATLAAWTALHTWFAWRLLLRVGLSECVYCGYPREQRAVLCRCPECGARHLLL